MPSIQEIRDQVQSPRKSVDAGYGLVMRRFSVYLTWLSFQAKLTPNQVTLISLLVMLAGVFFALQNNSILAWILGANLWYLIDHVDGELARLRNLKSNSGFYFDTILNFIVQPLFFVVLQILLEARGFSSQHWGWFAAYNLAMLSILTMTAEVICPSIHTAKQNQLPAPTSFPKLAFMAIHKSVLFPNILLAATGVSLLGLVSKEYSEQLLYIGLRWCALASLFVWVVQLAHTVIFKKLD